MLENIRSPEDLKNLDANQLSTLAEEIRGIIIDTVSKNGGHLASNLGMVEATLALHRMFDTPRDKIIFDVGHQCYAHKLVTGRFEKFSSLRKSGGISGFTRRGESEFDVFTAGHSGSSISASLGVAAANALNGSCAYTVCVVGDGSFTNGMIYEALNNCNNRKLKLIIILNDNEMSISSNVGSLASYLSRVRTSNKYFKFKHELQDVFVKLPAVGKPLIRFSRVTKNFLKNLLVQKNSFFSVLGVRYFGPVDGNDVARLETVIREAKRCGECCIIHMKTKKGKGYAFAQEHPELYHSIGVFDKEKGAVPNGKECFSSRFGDFLCEKAKNNEKLCAITAAMCDGTGLSEFSKLYPDRFFDVGIAEEHEIAFAAGLNESGFVPVCAVYSTFAQRVYDQVIHDAALQKLHIVLALDRAGFVPDDGITHQGLFDAALFSTVPDCTIYSPETYAELDYSLEKALNEQYVSVVRYPKGTTPDCDYSDFSYACDGELSVYGKENARVVIVTYGRVANNAYNAAKELEKKGISVRIIKLVKIYPVDKDVLSELIGNPELLYFLEEGIRSGGIGEHILSLVCNQLNGKSKINAVENTFAPHAKVEELYRLFGMDSQSVALQIEQLLKE